MLKISSKVTTYTYNHIRRLSHFLSTSQNMVPTYPNARRDETVVDEYFGIKVKDPYRWLEDPDSPETQQFVNAQNDITKPYIDSCPYKESIKTRITNWWNYPKYALPSKHGKKYFQYRNTGLQNQSVLFIQDSLSDEGRVFLDPNTLSEDGTVALSGTAFSEDGKTFAYGLSSSGSDWIEIRFKNVEDGKAYDEVLKKVKYSPMTWMHDNKGFFYGGYLNQLGKADGSETTNSENQKLYYHELGTDQSQDIEVIEFEDKELRMGANVTDCGEYLVVTPISGCKNNLLYFCKVDPSKKLTKKLELTPVVTQFEADYEYITNIGSKSLFRTNKNASNYKIVIIDFDNPVESEWKDLIEENPRDVLNWAQVINNNMLVVCYIKDVKLYHETKVGDFEASQYETSQVFYKSKDGTDIPMFIITKKGLKKDGSNPCVLYGYGGFNISLMPLFGVSRLVFLNNFNGVFALANIRGGGEYGDKWHNGGRFDKKQNCFDDFQWAAKYLSSEQYTNPKKLTIQGGSNGGLLVAACINQAPHLFGAAICQVGVLDMLRYHKFTIGYAWKSDYGCSDEKEQFEYLYKYSPLHNIRVPQGSEQYPATLLLTADHDDRVVPLHSLKFIAELQHKLGKHPAQQNPLMIQVETKAGHGAGKPTVKIIDEVTDIYCFVSTALDIPFQE